MCLAVPGRLVEVVDGTGEQLAVVDLAGSRRKVNIGMLPQPPKPGEWLLIHVGFAIECVDEETARTTMECLGMPMPPSGQPEPMAG